MSNSHDLKEFETAFCISVKEIQNISEIILDRKLTEDEVQYFIRRFEKHLNWEYIYEAIEDCLEDILE